MKCHICGIGLPEGATLIRQNALGFEGLWACLTHNTKVLSTVDQQLLADLQEFADGQKDSNV